MIDYNKLREYLHGIRKERKLSRGRIAEVIGISEDALGKFERGKCRIKLDNVIKLFDVYGISPEVLNNFYTRSERMQFEMNVLNNEMKEKAKKKAKREGIITG